MQKAKPTETIKEENKESFIDIYRRADRPDATRADRAALREYLDKKPEVWRMNADMMNQARLNLIEKVSATGTAKELMAHGCEQLKKELSLPTDGPLESLLIDAVVCAWLRLSVMEQAYDNVFNTSGGISLDRGIFWEKRLLASHKRFANTCTNLARVRKLQRPKAKNQLSFAQINQYLNQTGNERPFTLGESTAAFSLRNLKPRGKDEPANLKQLSNAKAE